MNRWARIWFLLSAATTLSIELAHTRHVRALKLAIADRVRGVAAERRSTQGDVALILGLSRQAVNARFTGQSPWLAHELGELAMRWNVSPDRLYLPPNRRDLVVAA